MWPRQYVDRNVCKFCLYEYEHDQTLNQLSSEQTLSLSHSYMNSSAASLTHGLQYLPKRKAFSRNDRNMWLFRQRASNVDWVRITSDFLWKSHDETRLRREKSELHQQSETAFIHSHVWWHQGYMLTQHTEPLTAWRHRGGELESLLYPTVELTDVRAGLMHRTTQCLLQTDGSRGCLKCSYSAVIPSCFCSKCSCLYWSFQLICVWN